MTKFLKTGGRLLIIALALLPAACNKDEDTRCDAEANTVAQAGILYGRVQSTQNCQLYKAAIYNYLNSACSNNLTSSERLQLQNQMNNLPC